MKRLTLMQSAALEWLWRYPDLTVSVSGFSRAWRGQNEHDSGNRIIGDLFGLRFPDALHSGYLTGGGTPKITRVTVESMVGSGFLTDEIDQKYMQTNYRPSKSGLEAYLRDRSLHEGKTVRLWGQRKSNPRPVGITEIKRRGGPESARNYMESHRRSEAHHKRIADHLEASLEEWDKHVEIQQESWRRLRSTS